MRRIPLLVALSLALAVAASAQPQPTELPDVSGTVAYAAQYNGILHVAVLLKNDGARDARASAALAYGEMVVIDAANRRKYFPLKDAADGHVLAGPESDWNSGGRWFAAVPAHGDVMVWAFYTALPPGSHISLEVPNVSTFDDIAVTEGPPAGPPDHPYVEGSLDGTVARAVRSPGQLKVVVQITNRGKGVAGGAAVRYADVFAFDEIGKVKYTLLKDEDGSFVATPVSDRNDGGRIFLNRVRPGATLMMNLTFQPPPDAVQTIDVVVPGFPPFESVALSGTAGAAAGGVAAEGRSTGVTGALKALHAEETPTEITVNLAADVLFAFDKATLQPQADSTLENVASVVKAYPQSRARIDGFTDAKGSDAYNRTLSQKRAQAVADWLASRGGIPAARLQVRGLGASDPVAPNTNPDGSDNPAGRAKNRRVRIVVSKT